MSSDFVMDTRSVELLEFALIQERLALLSSFDGGADLARQLVPSVSPADVARRRDEVEEAFRLEEAAISGPAGAHDVRRQIHYAARGGLCDIPTLERIDLTIGVAIEVRAQVLAQSDIAPHLAERLRVGISTLPLGALTTVLDRTLDRRGGVRDDATPELANARRQVSQARAEAATTLRRVAGRLAFHLQESFTTERGGRPVLAVKASSRSAVPGIVHDRSASGNTLFIEPLELLDAHNRLREAEAVEAGEIERIIVELSSRVATIAGELTSAIEALAAHDVTLACARLSHQWRGCVVETADDPLLVGARHPLLDPAHAVPIDLDLGGVRALVISGPNTGGKTVALKTLGLLMIVSQCGMRVPARDARLPVVDQILVDIGDDQSIALSLSTFSAHVRRLSQIIALAGPRSVVLLDEIAAGTDPDEGGPLAQAILERLVDAGARVLVTTHLGALKEWAVQFPGADNAAVAIDPDTHQPRYTITRGRYGASHALDIAESLGLPESVIAGARAAMSPVRVQADALVRAAADAQRAAESDRDEARRLRDEAEHGRREVARLQDDLAAQITRNRARLDADREEVRAAARRDLAEATAELRQLRDEIRAARREEAMRITQAQSTGPLDAARRRDRRLSHAADAARRASAALERPDLPSRHEVLQIGDAVREPRMGIRGVIVALEGAVAVIQGDRARLRLPIDRLEIDARGRPEAVAPSARRIPEARPDVMAAPSQLDVRGQRAEEACARVRSAVDDGAVAGRPYILVIHGHGTGALRSAIRAELTRHPLVDKVVPAPPNEGGDGATYAVLDEGQGPDVN